MQEAFRSGDDIPVAPDSPAFAGFLGAGLVPFGDKVPDYFRRYQSAQSQLNGILHSLRSGQDELTRDNVALNLEKSNLWAVMGRLNQYIYVAEKLDAKLSGKIAELELSDPETAKTLSQDVLFYVRQKHQDLLTQLAVSIQAYLAIDIIIKNNIELIKGVDRATTTTISALRTAFESAYERTYGAGTVLPGAGVELVNYGVASYVPVTQPPLRNLPRGGSDPQAGLLDQRPVYFRDRFHVTPVYSATTLTLTVGS